MWQASCFFSSSICARLTAVSGFSFNSWQSKKANKDIYRNVDIFLLKISSLIRPTVIIHFICSAVLLSPFFFVLSCENSFFILCLFSSFFLKFPLHFSFLFSFSSLNILGAAGTYFSITAPLIISVVPSPQQYADTPIPPLPIQLVLFDSCYLGKWQ